MTKKEILLKISAYLNEHKGVDPIIFTERTRVGDYGFCAEEWEMICNALEEIFEIDACDWPSPNSLTVGKWVDFVEHELKRCLITKKWPGIYLTAAGEFWKYRYGLKGEIEVKKRQPDDENEFFDLYHVEKETYLIHKKTGKIINLSDDMIKCVFWLDDFVCVAYPYQAQETYLYNQDAVRIELNLPEGQIYKDDFEYSQKWLCFRVNGCRFPYKLEDNLAKPVSEEEFCKNFHYSFEPSYGWQEIGKTLLKQM